MTGEIITEQEKIREGIAEFHYYFPNGKKRTEGRWDALSDDERMPYLHTAKLQVQYLYSKGVVIKVDGELPDEGMGTYESTRGAQLMYQKLMNAGYVAVEPLVEK